MAFEQQLIDIGALPNDGTGDPLRVAYDKINNNFANLFSTVTNTDAQTTTGPGIGSVVSIPASTITIGDFSIFTTDTITGDTQIARLSVSVSNANASFTATGISWSNTPLVTYDVEVVSGNLVVNVDSFVPNPLTHFIGSQVLLNGE